MHPNRDRAHNRIRQLRFDENRWSTSLQVFNMLTLAVTERKNGPGHRRVSLKSGYLWYPNEISNFQHELSHLGIRNRRLFRTDFVSRAF